MPSLFVFGLGYTAQAFARRLEDRGWTIRGTTRSGDDAGGFSGFAFDRSRGLDDEAITALVEADALLISIPPDAEGDPVVDRYGGILEKAQARWVGYLSTTGVYGDTGGREIDEEAPRNPTLARSKRRKAAEDAWLDLHRRSGLPVHLFRLAGIYGPGRSPFDAIREGRAKRIDRPGHLFGRIHVDDIAAVLEASLKTPRPGAAYNVTDDVPAAPSEVTEFACRLLGVTPPPIQPFEEAALEMSPMTLSFWQDNRRLSNALIGDELKVKLAYPSYREGLTAVLATESDPVVQAVTAPSESKTKQQRSAASMLRRGGKPRTISQ